MKWNYSVIFVVFIGFFMFVNCGGAPKFNSLSEDWALYIAKNPGGEGNKQAKNAVAQSKKLYLKGKRLHKSRRYATAIKKYEAALKLHATGDLYFEYANSLSNVRLKDSLIAYKIALKLNPSREDLVLYNLACAYSRSSMAKEGFVYLKKAFHAGYKAVDYIGTDSDLRFLRKQRAWEKVYAECENIYKKLLVISQLKFELIANGTAYEVSKGTGFKTKHLVIPAKYKGKPVTTIGLNAFEDCKSLTSVEISNGVTSVGANAFDNCRNITSIKIPNSVTSIGKAAFSNCRSLISIIIPDRVTIIGSSTFCFCSSLVSIKLPNSITSIGGWVFSGCSSLASIKIPNSVRTIDYVAFGSCTSLTNINIPNSVTTIVRGAFSGCSSLVSIKIGYNVNEIGLGAFDDSDSLTSVYLPKHSIARFKKLLPSDLHSKIIGY